MTVRFSTIDESNRADHSHLTAGDTCLYLYEYTSGRDYSFSQTNSLISNLKKKPATASPAELRYKEGAIIKCATAFREALNPSWLEIATLVPVPGSKIPPDPNYDDRLQRLCASIRNGQDVRQLVRQAGSTQAAHEAGAGQRVTVDELLDLYYIDEAVRNPRPAAIGVVDDVLTAGTHYRAMHTILSLHFPGVPLVGLFVARRVFPPD